MLNQLFGNKLKLFTLILLQNSCAKRPRLFHYWSFIKCCECRFIRKLYIEMQTSFQIVMMHMLNQLLGNKRKLFPLILLQHSSAKKTQTFSSLVLYRML